MFDSGTIPAYVIGAAVIAYAAEVDVQDLGVETRVFQQDAVLPELLRKYSVAVVCPHVECTRVLGNDIDTYPGPQIMAASSDFSNVLDR